MAPLLRALATLPDHPSLIPSIHIELTTVCNFRCKGITYIFNQNSHINPHNQKCRFEDIDELPTAYQELFLGRSERMP